MEHKTLPHPTIIKKMKTFLEVEGKMGPTPAPASQFRPPLPNTNPNIRKDNAAEKRKRAVAKRFRPVAPKPTATHPEAPPKRKNDVPDSQPVPVCKSTPWPGAGKMSGNLFEDKTCYCHQTIQAMTMKIRMKVNPRTQQVSQALDPS